MFDALNEYDTDLWVFTWWACMSFYDWRNHDADPERPTENQALDNISRQVYLASYIRSKYVRPKPEETEVFFR